MPGKTEQQKMLDGELYLASDPELVAQRAAARDLSKRYNVTTQDQPIEREAILRTLLGGLGTNVWIEPPFYVDYGSNIFLADGVYLNFNCIFLDCATIRVGSRSILGPLVQLYAAYHPVRASDRIAGPELAAPITIGENVWVGGGAIVCPGVTIGDNTTIGAGSVVVEDVPPKVLAVGNPCRVVRELE